ncbi:hypothetical protein T09_4704, partial [Trichinella sp. T9]
MHKNRFSALRYANNDRHKRCLIVSKGALVRLTYVASGSVKKSENGVDAKRKAVGRMQNNKREKTEFERPNKSSVHLQTIHLKASFCVNVKNFHIEQCIFLLFILYRGIEVPMHKNRFSALRYANNDRHKRCLIVSKGALVRLTYVASGS